MFYIRLDPVNIYQIIVSTGGPQNYVKFDPHDIKEYSSNSTDHDSKELPTIMKTAVQVLKYLFSDYTSAQEILRDFGHNERLVLYWIEFLKQNKYIEENNPVNSCQHIDLPKILVNPSNFIKVSTDPLDLFSDLFHNKLAHKELTLVHSECIVIVTTYRLIQNICGKCNDSG
jgi:hypothetical protein